MARRMPVPETRRKQTLQLPFPGESADNVFRYFRPTVSVSQHALQPRVDRSDGCHHQAGERTKGFDQFLYPARPSAHDIRPHMLAKHPGESYRDSTRAAHVQNDAKRAARKN
jgi:hypothetical protein